MSSGCLVGCIARTSGIDDAGSVWLGEVAAALEPGVAVRAVCAPPPVQATTGSRSVKTTGSRTCRHTLPFVRGAMATWTAEATRSRALVALVSRARALPFTEAAMGRWTGEATGSRGSDLGIRRPVFVVISQLLRSLSPGRSYTSPSPSWPIPLLAGTA
jgi:hypothetical protein